MREAILTILGLLIFLPSYPQELVSRWEEEKELSDFEYLVVSAEEEGLILFRDTDEYESGTQKWQLKFLDLDLKTRLEFDYYIRHDHNLIGYEYNNGYFYLLFQTGLAQDSDWELHRFDANEGNSSVYTIPNEIEIELSHFLITENNLVMGGKVITKPTVVHYSLDDEKVSVLPGFYRKETVLVDMRSNRNGTYNVLFLDREVNTGNNVLVFKVFSPGGDLLLESTSTFDDDLRVHSGISSELEGPDLIVTGTYGHKKSKLSQGFYFIKVQPGENDRIVFTDFTDLDKFFRYLGEDREERIKEKIQSSGKNKPYEFKTTLVVWKLVELNNKYALFAEVIDPQYQVPSSNRRRLTPYGHNTFETIDYPTDSRYYTSVHSLVNKDLMISVKYRQTALVVFDQDGKLLWDESHKIENLETAYLDQSAAYHHQNDQFQMVYKEKDELRFSFGRSEKLLVSDSTIAIRTLDEADDVKYDDSKIGKVEHWYDNYYYVWGYQRVQNRVSRERRNVFYVNKIRFD